MCVDMCDCREYEKATDVWNMKIRFLLNSDGKVGDKMVGSIEKLLNGFVLHALRK